MVHKALLSNVRVLQMGGFCMGSLFVQGVSVTNRLPERPTKVERGGSNNSLGSEVSRS